MEEHIADIAYYLRVIHFAVCIMLGMQVVRAISVR